MAKRFGRNQKRRLKEENAWLNHQVGFYKIANKELNTTLDQISFCFKTIKEVCGPNFIGLEPEQITGVDKRYSYVQVNRQRVDFKSYAKDEFTPACMQDTFQCLDLLKTKTRELDGVIHFNVEFSDKTVGYAISKNVLMSLHEDHAVELLSKKIATLILNDMKKD